MTQIVKYIGKKTAYYNDRSYFPDEVFEAPDKIPKKDNLGRPMYDEKGDPVMVPLVFGPYSKCQPATEDERAKYLAENPRAARRAENDAIIDRRADRRPFKETRLSSRQAKAHGLVS